ncbi:ubiquitin-conjugating enzyme/RWD-like protein [Auriculariales sp. MPI-PUGE-AT-0066]|nr:ubiquitin-conjugating enzyme/RWD-like protein [Auriculariales sp. MPI-PUGE-AT-0066]
MGSQFNPAVQRRLMREVAALRSDPPEGVRVVVDDENVTNLVGIIQGPENTPYEGGHFRVKFLFTDEFPAAPPKYAYANCEILSCWFTTKLFHPNVSQAGEICVNTLKKDLLPTHTLAHILTVVKCLLIYPNPESALDDDAGKLLLENHDDYCTRARIVTQVHATPKVRAPFIQIVMSLRRSDQLDGCRPVHGRAQRRRTCLHCRRLRRRAKAPRRRPRSCRCSSQQTHRHRHQRLAAKTIGVKRPATTTIDKRKKAFKRL